MSRLIVAAMLAFVALPTLGAPCAGFADVEDSDPFCPNVAWVRNRGITHGCATGLYCPESAVSRRSMAAFLNRLGDVLLPPNVIWVAPVGGQFQSIQSAIDYAASLPGPERRLVKVAPGTYNEAIVMASNVDVEGSGPGSTIISAAVCDHGTPTRGTVTNWWSSQLRDLTVWMSGVVPVGQCAAVYLDNVYGTVLRNVHIGMRLAGVGGGPIYGIIVNSTDIWGWSWAHLQDVTIVGIAEFSTVFGIRVIAGAAVLDRTQSYIVLGVAPRTPAVALKVDGEAYATAERSVLSWPDGAYAEVGGGGTLKIANSVLQGSLIGTATCIFNYDVNFAPATC